MCTTLHVQCRELKKVSKKCPTLMKTTGLCHSGVIPLWAYYMNKKMYQYSFLDQRDRSLKPKAFNGKQYMDFCLEKILQQVF